MEDVLIGYKDLAALPRDKAILDIERPDLMIYQPYYSYSPLEVIWTLRTGLVRTDLGQHQTQIKLQSRAELSTHQLLGFEEACPPGLSGPSSPEISDPFRLL